MLQVSSSPPRLCLTLALARLLLCASEALASEGEVGPRTSVAAIRASASPVVDGALDEAVWRLAPEAKDFHQVEPQQGALGTYDTRVRVLFDDQALYIGAECLDPESPGGVRVPDLRRDFEPAAHDLFGVALDPFLDGRNAIAFEVNAFGAQRDLQAFDDRLYDTQWDAIWTARARFIPGGWSVEIAIPWKSLRYPEGIERFGLQFMRTIRRLNETTGWSPWPRSFTAYRMKYAGTLVGISPPTPPVNLQLRPFVVGRGVRTGTDRLSLSPSLGGEVKWAPGPDKVIDVTVNTDFAEADADRQVVNLRRLNVFFPERRQFFLESASLFAVGQEGVLQPFFSRRIGLSDDGLPQRIDVGLRYVQRTPERSFGGMLLHTTPDEGSAGSMFGLLRYNQNVGEQSRVGGLLAARGDGVGAQGLEALNLVPALDGLWRSGGFTAAGMLSGSWDAIARGRPGVAGALNLREQESWGTLALDAAIASPRYEPRSGFVARTDFLLVNPNIALDLRPDWKPSFIRAFQPWLDAYSYHRASDGAFQEAGIRIEPTGMRFENGDETYIYHELNLQSLDAEFAPLPGLSFAPGFYRVFRHGFAYKRDASRAWTFQLRGNLGGYYDAQLAQGILTLAARPLPHVTLGLRYEVNHAYRLPGRPDASVTAHLVAPELRLAWSPQLQLVGFYQYSNVTSLADVNLRLAWEFLPLSYMYLVYNDVGRQGPDGATQREQQFLLKLTYILQV